MNILMNIKKLNLKEKFDKMKKIENNFKQELANNISINDLVTTGLADNLSELKEKANNAKKKYNKRALTWSIAGGIPFLALLSAMGYSLFAKEYNPNILEAIDYLDVVAIASNGYFGLKTAFAGTELNSAKIVYELGKSIEEEFKERIK
jgi:hypothetical protein